MTGAKVSDIASCDDIEKNGKGGPGSLAKEEPSYQDMIDKEKIVSLYLSQQGTQQHNKETYRRYLENSETMRATRRRQLFKQCNTATEDTGYDAVDYSMYRKRSCVSAVPKSPDSDMCGCNKPLSHPAHKYHPTSDSEWSYSKHTELQPTDAYGRVKFSSYQKAKYVRVDADTNPADVANLVQNVFNLHTPGVIISLKGSLLGFSVTSKVEKVIQRGIMKAAITTNGWLTTSGIDAGCVMSIGEALRMHNHTVPCIGFSSWGCLPEVVKEALVVPTDNGDGEYTCNYPRGKIKPGSAVENLEANHSHHILADTGGLSDWGSESSLRANWEAHMRDELNIPVVMVVMQGSIGASNFLVEGLRAGTPAVVIHGSGGVCDVIVNLVRHLKAVRNRHSRGRGMVKKQSSRRGSITEHIDICTCSFSLSMSCPVSVQTINAGNFDNYTKGNKKFMDNVYEIVTEYEDLLILFDLDDENYDGLDAALLEALVTAQNIHEAKGADDHDDKRASSKNLSGVQVALGWNRPDFAERLLKADNSAKDEVALGSILLHALAWNLHEFTELLLSHDASIPMVAANAVVLYNTSKSNGHLKRYARYNLGWKKGDFTKEIIDKMINKLASGRCNFASDVSNESDPYFELLVWASLSLNPEIAALMWKGTQEPIRAALFVVMILKRLGKAHKVIGNTNLKATLESMLDDFEGKAIAILDLLHETDATVCERALNSVWVRLGNKTYIDMAFKCRAREFIAHPACQEICESRWKRGLASEVNIIHVILTMVCPILLFTGFISYKSAVTRNCTSICSTFATKIKTWSTSPNVKFWFGVTMYMIFVVLQTHVIFTQMGRSTSFTPLQIVYLVWFGMLVVDEVMQVAHLSLGEWMRGLFNKVDVFMYLAITTGIVLVHLPDQTVISEGNTVTTENQYYDSGRIFLSLGSILFYVRILYMFTLDPALGPTILMITKMMGDFRVFLLMFFVVALAFGVGYAVALTDPEDWMVNGEYGDNTKGYIAGIFFYTYFQMFGEIFVEDVSDAGTFFTEKKVKSRHGFVIGLVGVYMAIVVLMLVNILIAMFSDTYTRIKDKEDVIFKYQRLELLLDTENSFLPPPFSFLHIFIAKTMACTSNKDSPFCHDRWKDTVIRSAVIDCLEEYLKRERSTKSSETEALLRESTRTLKNKLYKLQRYVENLQNSVDSVTSNPAFRASLAGPEKVEDV